MKKQELPIWWQNAVKHQQAGEMKKAEKLILDSVHELGAFASVAEIWKLRMQQLLAEGNSAGAHEAFEQSCSWITQYASGATSGGEGVALSMERDDHIAKLKKIIEKKSAK